MAGWTFRVIHVDAIRSERGGSVNSQDLLSELLDTIEVWLSWGYGS